MPESPPTAVSPAAAERGRALALYDLEHWSLAIVAFRKVLEIEADAASHARIAYSLDRLGRDDEALAEIDRAIAVGPPDEWYHRLRSYVLSRLDRDGEALVAARDAVRLKPAWIVTQVRLAYAASTRGPIAEAMKAALEGVRLGSRDTRALNAHARVIAATWDPPSAIAAYRKVLAIEPGETYATSEIARLSSGDEGVTLTRAAMINDPKNDFTRRNLVDKLLAVRRFAEAVDAGRAAVAHDADGPAYLVLVRALVAAGLLADARRTSAAAAAANPSSPSAQLAVVLAAGAQDDLPAVRAAIAAALAMPRVAHGLYAAALRLLGNDAATEVAATYRARDSDDPVWMNNLAFAHARAGRRDVALELALGGLSAPTSFTWEVITEIAAAIGPRAAALIDPMPSPAQLPPAGPMIRAVTLGHAARARGDVDAALLHYRAAITPQPYCCALYGLAACELARGDRAAAAEHVARAREVGPDCVGLTRHLVERDLGSATVRAHDG